MRFRLSVIALILAMLFLAGSASAAILRYQGSGDWMDTDPSDGAGWPWGPLPGPGDTVRINSNNTVTLEETADINMLQVGVDESGTLVINSGGTLNCAGNSKIGYIGPCTGTVIVNTGGAANFNGNWIMVAGHSDVTGILTLDGGDVTDAGHLWAATGANSTATITINSGSTLTIGGMLGLGTVNTVDPSGGTATLTVNEGGKLVLSDIREEIIIDPAIGNSIQPGSMLNINGTGQVTLPGDFESVVAAYVAAGTISGNGVVGNVTTDLTSNPGFTTIKAAASGEGEGEGDVPPYTEGTPVASVFGLGLISAACALGGAMAIGNKK